MAQPSDLLPNSPEDLLPRILADVFVPGKRPPPWLGAPGGDSAAGRLAVIHPAKLTEYRARISAALSLVHPDGPPRYAGPCGVSIVYWLDRPAGHYRTGRNAHLLRDDAPIRPIGHTTGDADKIARCALDAVTDSPRSARRRPCRRNSATSKRADPDGALGPGRPAPAIRARRETWPARAPAPPAAPFARPTSREPRSSVATPRARVAGHRTRVVWEYGTQDPARPAPTAASARARGPATFLVSGRHPADLHRGDRRALQPPASPVR